MVIAVAYAVLYLTAFFFGLDSLRGGAASGRHRILVLLVAGIGAHAAAQALYGYSVVAGPFAERFDRGALWLVGFGFLIWAALAARRMAGMAMPEHQAAEPSRQGETLIVGGALLAILVTGVLYRDSLAPQILMVLSLPVAVLIALMTAREYNNLHVEARLRRVAEAQAAVLRDTFDNMVEGIAMFGADGGLLAGNRRLEELFDLPPEVTKRGTTLDTFVRYVAGHGEYGTWTRTARSASRPCAGSRSPSITNNGTAR